MIDQGFFFDDSRRGHRLVVDVQRAHPSGVPICRYGCANEDGVEIGGYVFLAQKILRDSIIAKRREMPAVSVAEKSIDIQANVDCNNNGRKEGDRDDSRQEPTPGFHMLE